ncbi:SDR family oxidoreductase [Terrisporobacter sp.]
MYPVYKFIGSDTICSDVNIGFPPQHQDRMPGLEYIMQPRPISENPYYTPSNKLKDKVAIITGGDSGIGRAVAYLYAKEGADISIAYYPTDEKDAQETKCRIENIGRKCLLNPCDLTCPESSQKVVKNTIDTFGKIDILVNNCAVQYVQDDFLNISTDQLIKTFKTNVYSYFYMTQETLPYLNKGSVIINTTSITAFQGNKQLIDYSSTKGAILTFTKSLSQSLIDKGIRVNGVAPGPIWTPLIPSSFSAEEVKTFGSYTSEVPMGRAGQPYEVATCFLFLASDDSSYMSGQIIHPNGGAIVV